METKNKCVKCNKRFVVQEWKVGRERELCFTCCVQEKFMDENFPELSERYRAIFIMRFGLNRKGAKTLKEVGKAFGVTPERIRQIEANILEKIKYQ